jgi:DNA processing protein
MTSNSDILIFLSYFLKKQNNEWLENILLFYPSLESGFNDNFNKIEFPELRFSLKNIKSEQNIQLFDQNLTIWKEKNINYITFYDKNYPQDLLEAIPKVLYFFYQGDIELINSKNKLAIIGSRNIQFYSKQIIKKVLSNLKNTELVIISGLALGVDAEAHKQAIENNLKTIAILGSGLIDNVFYPKLNLSLKNEIVEKKGLVVSQFFPDQKATTYNFPIRNQVIVLFSSLVWIVQAKFKSGSLITSRLALDFGRELATTPANIFDPMYEANIDLIKNGSQIIICDDDIRSIFDLKKVEKVISKPQGDIDKLLNFIQIEPKDIDQIVDWVKENNIKIFDLFGELSKLELEGKLEQDSNGCYFSL